MDIIRKYKDSANSCFFVDPPYTISGKCAGKRLYKYHELLFKLFNKSSSDFLFTYDVSEEILKIAQIYKFQKALVPMRNTHHKKMEELIIGRDLSWLRD